MSDLSVGKWIAGSTGMKRVSRPVKLDMAGLRVKSAVALLEAAANMLGHEAGTGALNLFSNAVSDERVVMLRALGCVGVHGLPARELTSRQAGAGLWLLVGELHWPLWGAGSDLEVLEGLRLGVVVQDLAWWLERCGVAVLPEWASKQAEVRRQREEADYFALDA